MEKVTIIIPFYNVEDLIEECLDSVVGQTHTNLEILCIDDCSPDNSLDIVESFAARDERITIIRHKENLGLGGARNTGLKSASSDYICFVDSDDYVEERFVERLYQTMKSDESDIVMCGFRYFNDTSEEADYTRYDDDLVVIEETKDNVFDCENRMRGASWMKMYRRNLLCDNNIIQPEHRYYEGVLFWLRSIYYSTKISTISDVLYHYRKRDGSIMRSFSHKHIDDRFDYVAKIDAFFKQEILPSPGIDVYKAAQDAQNCMFKHLDYGETLIQYFGGPERDEYARYFDNSLKEFAETNHCTTIIPAYRAYRDSQLKTSEDKQRLEQMQAKLNSTQKKLDKLYNSRSWRLTSPLRKAVGILKK